MAKVITGEYVYAGKPPTLSGTGTAWDDYMIPGTSVKATGSSPPDLLGQFVGGNTLDIYAFGRC